MALKHELELDEILDDVEVELHTRDDNDAIAEYIVELLEQHLVLHWREISKLVRSKYTVSHERLQNIIRELVYSKRIVELACRFFTVPTALATNLNKLIELIERKVDALNLHRCSPPLASAQTPLRIRITRSQNNGNRVYVMFADTLLDYY